MIAADGSPSRPIIARRPTSGCGLAAVSIVCQACACGVAATGEVVLQRVRLTLLQGTGGGSLQQLMVVALLRAAVAAPPSAEESRHSSER
jgi:hypothetical protein